MTTAQLANPSVQGFEANGSGAGKTPRSWRAIFSVSRSAPSESSARLCISHQRAGDSQLPVSTA